MPPGIKLAIAFKSKPGCKHQEHNPIKIIIADHIESISTLVKFPY